MDEKEKNKKKRKKEQFQSGNTAERFSKKFHDLLSSREFSSEEELQKFIENVQDNYENFEPPEKTPLDRAQDLVYDAWESEGKERIRLARKALEISPDCADAYVILGNDAKDPKEALELYRKGIKAGERVLGQDFIEDEENIGHFWGLFSTRPYMRAKYSYAECLWILGRKEEAIDQYKDMLRLNPNDNQGVRYTLINCLISCGRDDEVWELLKNYSERSTSWAYSHALYAFRKLGECASSTTLLKKAFEENEFVPQFLTGERELSKSNPPYYSPGSIEEAEIYIHESLETWIDTENSLDWLQKVYNKYRRRN